MRRDKRYATRSVLPAQSGPCAVSSTLPQPKTPHVWPERGNRTPGIKSLQHSINEFSPGTDQLDDSLRASRSKVRENISGNVELPRQSVRLRKSDYGKVQENGACEDLMVYEQPHSYIGCEGERYEAIEQPVDFKSKYTRIKVEYPENMADSVCDNHICPKKASFAAGRSDYTNNGNVSSSREIKNLERLQGHWCRTGSNGYLSDYHVSSCVLSGIANSSGASAETMCNRSSVRNLRCQEEKTFSKTERSDCKRNRPLSHVNQSNDTKPRENRVVKKDKVSCLPSCQSHDTESEEQTENCIMVKSEVPDEDYPVCERNPPRQSTLPTRNHTSSYKYHSSRTDSCSPGSSPSDLSSSFRLDQAKQSACNQQKSLDENKDLVACNEHPDMYTLGNRKSRTIQKISRKSHSLNTAYREYKVTKSSLSEELYQSPSIPSSSSTPFSTPPSLSSTQSQNSKLFPPEATGSDSEASCVKSSLLYEQRSVINQRHLASSPRKIQDRFSCPLSCNLPKEEPGRSSSHNLCADEGQSPPVFKNVSEALHRLPERPKVPLVCMKDVIIIDSSPGSETSTACYHSSPKQSSTAISKQYPQRDTSSSESRTAQRLCFVHEKESRTLASKTKISKDNTVSHDKNLGSDAKKDTSIKAASPKATTNSVTSRSMEKSIPVHNTDLILSRKDRIRSPSIRYKDDVLFFPLVFPSRSSQSATNRISEVVDSKSNNRESQAELNDKITLKKENGKGSENVNMEGKKKCLKKGNSDLASLSSLKSSESFNHKRILRGSSMKQENVVATQGSAAPASEPSEVIPLPKKDEHISHHPLTKTVSNGCLSGFSPDSPLPPPKSNKVLRSQSSSLKTSTSPLSPTPPSSPTASLSPQTPNPEQKCSSSSKMSPSNAAGSTKELRKTPKQKPNVIPSKSVDPIPDSKNTIEDQTNSIQEPKDKMKANKPYAKPPQIDQSDEVQELKITRNQQSSSSESGLMDLGDSYQELRKIMKREPITDYTNQPKATTSDTKCAPMDQSDMTKETGMKSKQKPNTSQPKITTSNAEATITDIACGSQLRADSFSLKKVSRKVSKLRSCLRSHCSSSAVIKKPAPLSILSRHERASSETKKLNAFVGDELDKYLAQEIGNYIIYPQRIASTSNTIPSVKRINGEDSKKGIKRLDFSSKKISCDKKLITIKKEQSSCISLEKPDTAAAFNTRTSRSLSNILCPEKNDSNLTATPSNSLDFTPMTFKPDPDAVSSKSTKKQTYSSNETPPLSTPTYFPSPRSEKQIRTRSETGRLPDLIPLFPRIETEPTKTKIPTPSSFKTPEKQMRSQREIKPLSALTPSFSKISEKISHKTELLPEPIAASSTTSDRQLRARSITGLVLPPTPTSSKIFEKPTCTLNEPEPSPSPTSSDWQSSRNLRPRPDLNKPGSSFPTSNVFTNNTQSYEPDFDEVDGILFMSFPNVESLQAHIAVERKSNWESAPSHMSSISKVLNFNRWKERHKSKLPRPAFDKSKNLRGLHMRMKLYYKLLRAEWHKIKQRNQHRSRYGFKKTSDFSKIKSWQARFNKNMVSKKNSQRLNWRTQDRITRSLKADDSQQMGVVKKRRKNSIFTHRKSSRCACASVNAVPESCRTLPSEYLVRSVDRKKKQNKPSSTSHKVKKEVKPSVSAASSDSEITVLDSAHLLYEADEINLIKKLGGCDPCDHTMRKRTRSQVELENLHRRSKNLPPIALDWLTHNMVQTAMKALHVDFVKKKNSNAGKSISNVNSEDEHNTDTFIQVDSTQVAGDKSNGEASPLPSLFESQKYRLSSGRTPSSAIRLCKTSDEDLAKETARILLARQKLKAVDQKCNKPGCRYGCVCHLCWISDNFEDSNKTSAICTKTCDKEYCRLGCICDSNDNIKLENMCDNQTCTLECCRCSEHKSVTSKCSREKESLKRMPVTHSDVIDIFPQKIMDDAEPEPSFRGEMDKSKNAEDMFDSKTLQDEDSGREVNTRVDVCAEQLKSVRKEQPASLLKRESTHKDGKNSDTSSRKPLANEDSEIFHAKKKRKLNFDSTSPKVNSTKVNQLQTKSSSAYSEDEKDNSKTGPPPNSIKSRLCPLRDDCRQPLEQCYVNCSWFPANTFDNCVVEIDRLESPQQMRQLGCMSVDCFPQSTKGCTPHQIENSSNCTSSGSDSTNANNTNRHTDCIKCELIDLSPIKVKPSGEVMSPPVPKVTDSSPSPQTKSNSISPPRLLGEVADSEKWSCPLVDLTVVSTEDPAESRIDKDWQVKMICLKAKPDGGLSTQNMEEGYQLLEFISNCNWDSHSSEIICQVSLCCEPGKYPDPQKMAVGSFDVEILPKSDKAPNVPARLQSEIFCCPYNIRVKITDRTKSTGCEKKMEPLLDGCSYVGITSVRPVRNNNQLDIKSMSLTATLQDINYQCQEDNEQNEIPNEAKNVVGEIEVLELHPSLDDPKMSAQALVLGLSPENQKAVASEQVNIVTELSPHDLQSERLAEPKKQAIDSVEEIHHTQFSQNVVTSSDQLTFKSKRSSEREEKMKTTADATPCARVSQQCTGGEKPAAHVASDWPQRSKFGNKAMKQELPSVSDLSLEKSPNDCDSLDENSKSRNDDSPRQIQNDSTETKTDLSPNCPMQNTKSHQCELDTKTEKTPASQSFSKVLPRRSLNGSFFVTSSQHSVSPFYFGHLQGCSLVHADLNNFTAVPHNHMACSTFPNTYKLDGVPTNQYLQLVPVPVPISFSVAPDGSAVNSNVTIPIINSSCHSRTNACNTSPSSVSHSLTTNATCCSTHLSTKGTTCFTSHSVTSGSTCCKSHSATERMTCCSSHAASMKNRHCCNTHLVTDMTCCGSCCSCSEFTNNTNDPCRAETNSHTCCKIGSCHNSKKPVNEPPSPVHQPGHILVSQGQNNAILIPYNTFVEKNANVDNQEHCADNCLATEKSSQKNFLGLQEFRVVPNTNNELFNCQDTTVSIQTNVAASSKKGIPQQQHQQHKRMCAVFSQTPKEEEVEKKSCAKKTQMKEEPSTMNVEPVNCSSSLQSGLNFDFRQDPIDEEDFDDEDWAEFDDFDPSGKDRRNQHQLSIHKTRERERCCNIFNGINILQEVLCKNEDIQFISQRKILDFATDHIKSLETAEVELTGEKSSLGEINHQLWEQLKKVKDELKLQNVSECELNRILDESGLPFDMYLPPARDSTKLEDYSGSPLKLLPVLDSYEASDVESKDHSDIECELDVRLVSSSLPQQSPSLPPTGPLNEVLSSDEDTILMSPVTSQQLQDLDDDVEKAERESMESSQPE